MLSVLLFSGFYESLHASKLEDALDFLISPELDPNPAREEALYAAIKWRQAHDLYAKLYTTRLSTAMEIDITFDHLSSPREYNFETDKILAEIALPDLQRLLTALPKDTLPTLVRERCTSRSGFMSYFPANFSHWKPLHLWEPAQIQLLLEASADHLDIDEDELVDDCNGEITEIIETCIPDLTALLARFPETAP